MARSVQEIARKGRSTWAMDVSCPKCAHRLWAEKVSVAEHFDVWAFFDDEELATPTPSESGCVRSVGRG
jgi:hypothetical protein